MGALKDLSVLPLLVDEYAGLPGTHTRRDWVQDFFRLKVRALLQNIESLIVDVPLLLATRMFDPSLHSFKAWRRCFDLRRYANQLVSSPWLNEVDQRIEAALKLFSEILEFDFVVKRNRPLAPEER